MIFNLLLFVESVLLFCIMSLPYLHNAQLNGYRADKAFSNNKRLLHNYLAAIIISAVFCGAFLWLSGSKKSGELKPLLSAAFFLVQLFPKKEVKLKKPLVYTKRLLRLLAAEMIITAAAYYFICFSGAENLKYLAYLLIPSLVPVIILLALTAVSPLEKLNNKRYIKKASKKLNGNKNLIKIGITGSYGKTAVKNILAEMLKTQYTVFETPQNYNTPLGIAKCIEGVTDKTEVFIAEMGARRVGDIKELAAMVKPQYGILTGICVQHLESFKTLDNIIKEKYELPISLPAEGYAVLGTGENFKLNYLVKADLVTAGAGGQVFAERVKTSPLGTQFVLRFKDRQIFAVTGLLGAHNVSNIVQAAALASHLGISDPNLIKSIAALKPLPHRLQLIKNRGLTIIDDTYNANPKGTAAALDVLSVFEGRKVVITPGMIELGDAEKEENFKLGVNIAEVADLVILIGKYPAGEVEKGLKSRGFPEQNLFTFACLFDAERKFGQLLCAGDTVLFCNDLPDNYS